MMTSFADASAAASGSVVPPTGALPPHESALRREVREFLDHTEFTPYLDPMIRGFDPAFSKALGQRGFIGMTFPEHYGGQGRSPLERYIVIEELLAAGAPVAAHWTADRQVAPSLLQHGNEMLKQRFLPAIASGECCFAIGLSEPDAGSDLAAIRTRATRTEGGWSLSGRKIWTSSAPSAHAIVVLARTEPKSEKDRHAGMSQLVVLLPADGATVRPIRNLAGEEHFGEITFDDVFVPDMMVLGEVGAGWAQATAELAYERSGPDRLLSTLQLLPGVDGADRGRLLARLWALRHGSIAVNAAIAHGAPPETQAVMVKDLGTQFELDVLDEAMAQTETEPDIESADATARQHAQASMAAPSFTVRGGTTEILRGVIARGLGVR